LVIVGEGIFVRDFRGIGQMGVMCRIGIVDYSASGECGGGRSSRVKAVGGDEEGKVEKGENGRKGQKKNHCERERKVQQEKAKQINIWTERKREIRNTGL
jgi:hypothetical protein